MPFRRVELVVAGVVRARRVVHRQARQRKLGYVLTAHGRDAGRPRGKPVGAMGFASAMHVCAIFQSQAGPRQRAPRRRGRGDERGRSAPIAWKLAGPPQHRMQFGVEASVNTMRTREATLNLVARLPFRFACLGKSIMKRLQFGCRNIRAASQGGTLLV